MRTEKGIKEARQLYDAAMAGDATAMIIFSEIISAGELTDEKQAEIIKRVKDEQKRSNL